MQSEIEAMGERAEVNVRSMEAADADAVAELTGQLGYERTAAQVREWIECLRGREGQSAFVAELGGEVVGWIEVSIERRLQSGIYGLVGGLVVREGVRGGGVGRRLCERAEAWSREQGARKIRVTSRSTREAAHRFYLRDGYRQVKVSMVFEKELGSS